MPFYSLFLQALICASEASAYKHVYGHMYSCFYGFTFTVTARGAIIAVGPTRVYFCFSLGFGSSTHISTVVFPLWCRSVSVRLLCPHLRIGGSILRLPNLLLAYRREKKACFCFYNIKKWYRSGLLRPLVANEKPMLCMMLFIVYGPETYRVPEAWMGCSVGTTQNDDI
jgi:hypothetical protein